MDSSLKGTKFGVIHTSPSEMLTNTLTLGKLYFAQGDASGAAKQGIYALTNSADDDSVAELTMFGTGAVADGTGYGLSQANFTTTEKNKLAAFSAASNYLLKSNYVLVDKDSSGYVPMADASAGTIDSQTNDWVLTFDGSNVDWYKLPANAFKNDNTVYTHPAAGTATQSFGATSTGTTVSPGTLTKIATIYDASFDASGHFKGKVARDISINISKPSTAGTADVANKTTGTLTFKVDGADASSFNGSANRSLNFKSGTNISITESSDGVLSFSTSGVPTTSEMDAAISSALTSALKYKGTVDGSAFKLPSTHSTGDVYVASKSFTTTTTETGVEYAVESGDYFISNGTIFNVVNGENQVSNANDELAWNSSTKIATVDGTDIYVKLPSNPNTDTKVTSAGNHYTPAAYDSSKITLTATSSTAATWGSTDMVTGITVQRDAKGHITDVSISSIQMPANPNIDTKNTAGSTASTSKLFLVGATSQAANPQTYSNASVYIDGSALYSEGKKVLTSYENTKVTSVGNHYTPTANTSSALSVDASSSTSATWGSTDLVTGVNIQRDAAGHVTGITVDSIQMPANPNTDTKVTNASNAAKSYLLGHTSQGLTATATTQSAVYMTSGKLYATSGSVASGDTALVTGGTVYTSINNAKSEAITEATIYWETL